MKEEIGLLRALVSMHVMRFASELQAMHYKPPGPINQISDDEFTVAPPEELGREDALRMAAERVRKEMPTVIKHLGLDG